MYVMYVEMFYDDVIYWEGFGLLCNLLGDCYNVIYLEGIGL